MKERALSGLIIGFFVVCFMDADLSMATTVELDHATTTTTTTNMNYGRGILFHADESFSIDAVSFYARLVRDSYWVNIYPSSGEGSYDSDTPLAKNWGVSGGENYTTYHEIGINYTFTAGNYYFINWTRNGGDYIM